MTFCLHFGDGGKKVGKNKNIILKYISNLIVNIFLLTTFYIMIAGFGAYFEQKFHINKIIGAGILSIMSYLILIKDIHGVAKTNAIVVPILIIVILIIGTQNIDKIKIEKISTQLSYKWVIQSIIYCSYNMILVIPVLVGLKQYIKSKKQIIIISISSAIIVFALAICIFFLLTNINNEINNIEMPAVYAITTSFSRYEWIYGIVILISIFSTAISIGISFLKNTVKDKKNYPQFVGIMCISGVIISNIGFSKLVQMLFPLFGYLGLIQILKILLYKVGKFDKKDN